MQRIHVEDVEPSDNRPVEQNGADAIEGPQASYERDDPPRPVRPVDPHLSRSDRLHVLRQREGDRRDRRRALVPVERPVVHPDDAGVGLSEGTPQG